ncbi:Dihydropteroate synthase [Caulifigura coniformis]|uniref:Dihydropteroate synthase n=1 Tax=Caulifigura coniformis TaxID=2527983 RepID=A0A517S8Q9_9PLAN|nr:dihydropteroate synthase [Caulifigura coniformis]QDT52517.1 Dihydropteroate synthase [Caulifigura coniformis]
MMHSSMFPESPSLWALDSATRWTFNGPAKVMGILNVTPDSFSDGGRWVATSAAVEHALDLARQGADIIDVGGESTRPGSLPVDPEEQLRRILPVLQELQGRLQIPVSVDTSSSLVARETLAAGATIVNDVTGMSGDPAMVGVCAESGCGVIVMHMQGTPQTMQLAPRYDDVVREVTSHLQQRVRELGTQGIPAERIVVDPGIGFGKTPDHNLQILSNIAALRSIGRPVLIGHSRKRFLQKVLGRPVEEATAGTIGVAIAVAQQGAGLIRVHDVQAVKDALTAWDTVRSAAFTGASGG